jgi:hypothetical protein
MVDVFEDNVWGGIVCRMLCSVCVYYTLFISTLHSLYHTKPYLLYDGTHGDLATPEKKVRIVKTMATTRTDKSSIKPITYFKMTICTDNFIHLIGSAAVKPRQFPKTIWMPELLLKATGIISATTQDPAIFSPSKLPKKRPIDVIELTDSEDDPVASSSRKKTKGKVVQLGDIIDLTGRTD